MLRQTDLPSDTLVLPVSWEGISGDWPWVGITPIPLKYVRSFTRCFWQAPGKVFPFIGPEAFNQGRRNLLSVGANWPDASTMTATACLFFTRHKLFTLVLYLYSAATSCWCHATKELCRRWTTGKLVREKPASFSSMPWDYFQDSVGCLVPKGNTVILG